MRVLLLSLILCFCGAGMALAAVDEVRVSQFINADFTAPTTPGNLTATTTTFDRIYVTWDASTDNYLLSGYQVFRDAVQVATTSLTTYTDTGLTASTSYTYHVIAFDHGFLFSSSSNFATATTTDVPPPEPETLPSPTLTEVKLRGISIEPDITGTLISWTTNRATRYELRWGRTQSYELGFVTGHLYHQDHTTYIDGLEPDTIYEYEIVSYDRGGNSRILSQGRFRTLTQPDIIAPSNVADFRASAESADVLLSWKNPVQDFAYVRIVRNPFFYPRDPNDGFVIYQGTLDAFRDRAALENFNELYYTAFVFDNSGNRSSGAVTRVARLERAAAGVGQEITGTDFATTSEGFTFSIEDILVMQAGEIIRPVSGTFLVDTAKEFTIHAPYDIFPEHLKTIQATLSHPLDEADQQSFLLRINNDKTAYEATISQLGYQGTIPLRLTMFDFFTNTMTFTEGFIISQEIEPEVAVVTNIASDWPAYLWGLLLLLLLLFWFFIAVRRRAEDKRPVRLR